MPVAQEVWICRHCEQVVDRNAAVCHSCGTMFVPGEDIIPLRELPPDGAMRCAYCAQVLDPGAAVCHSCGCVLPRRG
ncbi:MAG: zinc ribbon domain-containing protein [Bryobacteraceae bacterium]|nr:zinc ribbon domain-containing protein [Bryobacteraceae bacterium]